MEVNRVDNKDGRRVFIRVRVSLRQGRYFARVAGSQGSGILTSMTEADGLMIIPENMPQVVEEGDTVTVQMLDWIQDLQN